MTTLLSASLIAADLSTPQSLQEAVVFAERAGADFLHIDVQDGVASSQVSPFNNPSILSHIHSPLPLEVHLMVEHPEQRVLEYVHAGAKMISFQVEDALDPEVLLSKLHRWHVKAGLAIKPRTPVEKILPYLPIIDYVLVLCVNPGPAGQQFIPEGLETIYAIRSHNKDVPIIVDGGMNLERSPLAVKAGATIIAAGAALYNSEHPAQFVKEIRSLTR
jgi:ribulose-phosphate 3-epimerase